MMPVRPLSEPPARPPALGPGEVRALRGAASRAAFAARLGVTPLTVYRWELPQGAREARSPRGRHLTALRLLADPAASAADASAAEDRRAAKLLFDLGRGRWDAVEHDGLASLARGRIGASDARALVVVAVAQARVVGRLDARGAFLMLAPVLAQRRGDRAIAVRAHVVAAMVHAVRGEPSFDRAKVEGHLAAARVLFPSADLLALASAVALEARAADEDACAFARAFSAARGALDGASEPVTRCLVEEARATAARVAGDRESERKHLFAALFAARALAFAAAEARMLTRLARAALAEGAFEEAMACCAEASAALRRAVVTTSAHVAIEQARADALVGLSVDARARRTRAPRRMRPC